MKKNTLIIIIVIVILAIGSIFLISRESNKNNYTLLMNHSKYKNLKLDNVEWIEVLRYTEAGLEKEEIKEDKLISSSYNYLANIKLGAKTEQACEDNTTIYVLHLNDGKEKNITIECDWVIIDNNRYLINKE